MRNDIQLTIVNHLTRVLRSHGSVTALSESQIEFVAKNGFAAKVTFGDKKPILLEPSSGEAETFEVFSSSETAAKILKRIGELMKQ